MTTATERQKAAYPYIKAWLWIVAFLVFVLVVVGGATRLTDSGLSITEWQPLEGIIPPLSQADWQAVFDKYRQSSEYLLQNKGMTLAEFEVIYWWEWGHRFLGRLIGVAFALPLLVFLVLGRIEWRLLPRLVVIFLLGAAQGALGWYMVESGLAGRVDVSQYRLAAHLTLAAAILAAIVWTVLGIDARRRRPNAGQEWLAALILALMFVQIATGGFVAGLDAGMGYNTWPLMDGQWLPAGLMIMEPFWRNFFENAMTVQFQHRVLAYVIIALMAWHAWSAFTIRGWVMLYIALIQVILGIWTLLWHVKLPLAMLHQATAMILLGLAVWNLSGFLSIAEAKRPEDESQTALSLPKA